MSAYLVGAYFAPLGGLVFSIYPVQFYTLGEERQQKQKLRNYALGAGEKAQQVKRECGFSRGLEFGSQQPRGAADNS